VKSEGELGDISFNLLDTSVKFSIYPCPKSDLRNINLSCGLPVSQAPEFEGELGEGFVTAFDSRQFTNDDLEDFDCSFSFCSYTVLRVESGR
jgi:hypothetical protein